MPRNCSIDQFPHCDQRVLHAPGECRYCDGHPEWQELRKGWGVAFTGHAPVNASTTGRDVELPCPSDYNRGTGGAHAWGGNTPRPISATTVTATLVKCDRCGEGLKASPAGGMTSGYYLGWKGFMKPGENILCDNCMWTEPRYIAIYGEQR